MILEARGLVVGYGREPVAGPLDLRVPRGELVCLLGPNGGGKTTLFRTLLGLLPAIEGAVTLDGAPLARLDRRAVARAIAYVPQASPPPFPFTLGHFVLLGRTAHLGPFAAPGAADRAAAEAAIATLGLEPLAARPVTELSGGQRQLGLIARALAQGAAILVMDEPTASLDFGNQAKVLSVVEGLKARGLGVVLSTHDPAQAFRLADRVLLLGEGRILTEGRPAEVLTADRLSALYGVPVAVGAIAGRTLGVPL